MSALSLAVVIPTLNAAATLGATLGALQGDVRRLVVADGGSNDATLDLARSNGALVVECPPGRGAQLAAGAAAVEEDWILFLHADTRLGGGWRPVVEEFAANPDNARHAGYFRLRFDTPNPAARRVERLAGWRARALGLPYGDQGLLIARGFYGSLGGFRPLPLMEDVEFVRRVGPARLRELPVEALTSAARYERDGWLARPLRNMACLTLYAVGVPPRIIRTLYG
ncbi:TIGR04283 family arsenosugar biosynthesis glycosyltransferase [Azospirillum canadense]|uniref:TIGR04283 family arsenosugar biosynthesis glycosyltransferase n=1 Tax=Azospirillum canadense TaxID=403962 RepID=UPI002225F8F3|nr:TIGR04283 family arsenosugar biosynthesis glycosyltransferase [Azospirillum canadense]MCW2236968.1 rSAM/selenodomain-associated transferase 2 [Azospirillum canadense]